jgi:hypothetical protein
MGDRCYVNVTVGGKIKSPEALEALIQALDAEELSPNDNEENVSARSIRESSRLKHSLSYYAEEVNYGQLPTLIAFYEEHGKELTILIENEAGDDYGAGMELFCPEGHFLETSYDHGPCISAQSLLTALANGQTLEDVVAPLRKFMVIPPIEIAFEETVA